MRINVFFKKSFLAIIFVCSILICFAQCKQDAAAEFKSKGGLRVLVGLDDASLKQDDGSVEIRNEVMKVLRNRIEYYGVTPHIEWLESERQILVEIPGVKEPERVLELLQNEMNLEFWATYELTDISDSLISADKRLAQLLGSDKGSDIDRQKTISLSNIDQEIKYLEDELEALLDMKESPKPKKDSFSYREFEASHPLLKKLQINIYQTAEGYEDVPGPVVGYAIMGDMDQVTEYLNMAEIKSILPLDIVFRWAAKSLDERGKMYELFALKKTMREGALLDGSVVTEAKVEPDGQGGIAVGLRMNDEAVRMWARITKDNLGKCIAMVVDDRVYSAPRVNDQITGGRFLITGDFTKEEASDMANLLNAGRMPVPIRILKHEMVTPDKQ